MTALPQSRIEQDLREQLASEHASLTRCADRLTAAREALRTIAALAADDDVRADCGPTGHRALDRIAALAAGR